MTDQYYASNSKMKLVSDFDIKESSSLIVDFDEYPNEWII